MADNLLIRNLSEPTNKALDRFKQYYPVDVNTKAADTMIREYWPLKDRVAELSTQLDELQRKYHRLLRALAQRQEAEQMIDQILKQDA